MSERKQANRLNSGDRFRVQLSIDFEVVDAPTSNGAEGHVNVLVRPVACGEGCSQSCDCHYSLFDGAEGPYPLQLKTSQRVAFFGNLTHLLAESERLKAQIERLQSPDAEQATTPGEPTVADSIDFRASNEANR